MVSRARVALPLALGLLLWPGQAPARAVLSGGHNGTRSGQAKARAGAQKKAIPVHELQQGETIRFSAPAIGIMQSAMQCGTSGDIFLVYGTNPRAVLASSNGAAPLPIQKVSPVSQVVTPFAVQSLGDYQAFRRSKFSVGRRGTVYALYTAFRHSRGLGIGVELEQLERPAHVIVKFNEDGSVDSTIVLENPPAGRLDPMLFDAFPDGQFLVTGTVSVGPGLGKTTPFTGIFDRSGAFEQQLKLPHDVRPRLHANAGGATTGGSRKAASAPRKKVPRSRKGMEAKNPPVNWQFAVGEGSIFSGPTDNLYLLRKSNPPELYVVSSDGQVVREFRIRPPRPGLSLIEIGPAGEGDLFAQFVGPASKEHGPNGPVLMTFSVIDAASGETLAAYRFPPKVGLLPGCAEGPNTFEFLGSTKDHKLKVVDFHSE